MDDDTLDMETKKTRAWHSGNFDEVYPGVFKPRVSDDELIDPDEDLELYVQYVLGYYASYELHEIEAVDDEHAALVALHRMMEAPGATGV